MSFELTMSKAPGCSNERAQEEDCSISARRRKCVLSETEPLCRSTGELIGPPVAA
jgi:hypothetical protein